MFSEISPWHSSLWRLLLPRTVFFAGTGCVLRVLGALGGMPVGEWLPGLEATVFWDCSGAACDSATLKPFDKLEFRYAVQYAPTNPLNFGGPTYGEKLWLTGAASDALAPHLGPDSGCCGSDLERGGGCGRCLLVRNPQAKNADWTAVVMKKSACPPWSHGCELPRKHFDLAVPGYDSVNASTANVCGSPKVKDTWITQAESGACTSLFVGNIPTSPCTCEGISNNTEESAILRQGCELFSEWGWTTFDPLLEFQSVQCPKAFTDRVKDAFNTYGVASLHSRPWWPWLVGSSGAFVCICAGFGCRQHRQERRTRMEREAHKIKMKQRKANPRFGGTPAASDREESSSDLNASSSDTDDVEEAEGARGVFGCRGGC